MNAEQAGKMSSFAEHIASQLKEPFLYDPIPLDPEGQYSHRQCSVDGCDRSSRAKSPVLCRLHRHAYINAAEPPLSEWLATQQSLSVTRRRGSGSSFNLAAVGRLSIRNELAYGLMKRGERGRASAPDVVLRLARELASRPIESILDVRYDEEEICKIAAACGGYKDTAKSFLLDTLDELCILAEIEPTRRYLGIAAAGGGVFVNLNQISSDRFRTSLTKWVDYRTNIELGSPSYLQQVVADMALFLQWLGEQGVDTWVGITREHLLKFSGYVRQIKQPNEKPYAPATVSRIVGSVSLFIQEATMNGWADIPPGTRWLSSERPKVPDNPPRLIGRQTVARLRDPGNLQLVENLDLRLIIRIAAETGLRRKDIVVGFQTDCLMDVGEDKWSVRYSYSKDKMNPSRTIPITPALADAIAEHIAYKQESLPGTRNLFARDSDDTPLTLTLVNKELTNLIQKLDIRDSSGEHIKVTPHMFRHQNATDWLNDGVSLPAIQKLLGHKSITSTEIYARMSEEKARSEWEKSRAVNYLGELVPDPSGDIADAAWSHAFLGGATQALPNGRCGMPCGETCEHANACLYCPLFLTTPEYLPVLREERDDAESMMKLAEAEGFQRIVERNRKPFIALTTLITNLEELESRQVHTEGSDS
ncbi:tyrosine-type recombinase/integrase [Arthrobacter sp. NPDC056886]|uniref:tyrosine-type recombinase/integrase n=1 Tax=Arthrobacter sp. NPDC056886 TaxID=3345960 RepID=UPI00367139F6